MNAAMRKALRINSGPTEPISQEYSSPSYTEWAKRFQGNVKNWVTKKLGKNKLPNDFNTMEYTKMGNLIKQAREENKRMGNDPQPLEGGKRRKTRKNRKTRKGRRGTRRM